MLTYDIVKQGNEYLVFETPENIQGIEVYVFDNETSAKGFIEYMQEKYEGVEK